MAKATTLLEVIERLIKAGYPEGTAKKIASGELDMSLSARNARMKEQGYDPTVTYHYGPKGIQEFKIPADNRKYKFGPGVYSSPRPEYGERYLAMRGIDPKDAEAYHLVSRGKMADDKIMNDLHYEAVERGGGPASRDYWSGMQSALQDRGYTGLDFMGERNVFDPANIRDVNRAAFDPDNKGLPNILGSAAPVAAGGILAALGGNDAQASEYRPTDKSVADLAQRTIRQSYDPLPRVGSIEGVPNNPVSQGANTAAFKLDRLNRNLQNAGILSLLAPESTPDVLGRAAYGESRWYDPALVLLDFL